MGSGYFETPGTSNNYASLPHIAAYSPTNTLRIDVRAVGDIWNRGTEEQALLAQVQVAQNFIFRLTTTGALEFNYSGVSRATSSSPVSIPNAMVGWLRCNVTFGTGGAASVTFFESTSQTLDPDAVSWTEISTHTGLSFASQAHSALMTVGARGTSFTNAFDGRFQRVRYQVDGVTQVDIDFTSMTSAQAAAGSFTESSPNAATVTMTGGTPIPSRATTGNNAWINVPKGAGLENWMYDHSPPANAGVAVGEVATLACWFRVPSHQAQSDFVGTRNDTGSQNGFNLNIDVSGNYRVLTDSGNDNANVNWGSQPALNEWHYMVGWVNRTGAAVNGWDPHTLYLSIDGGTPVSASAPSGHGTYIGERLGIFGRGDSTGRMFGQWSTAEMYKSLPTSLAQIQSVYNAGRHTALNLSSPVFVVRAAAITDGPLLASTYTDPQSNEWTIGSGLTATMANEPVASQRFFDVDPSSAAGWVTTPNHASFNFNNDLDIRVRVRLHSYSGATHTYFAKWASGVASDQSYLLRRNATGFLELQWVNTSNNTVTATADTTIAAASGIVDDVGIIDLRATLTLDNGAGNREVKFWWRLASEDMEDITSDSAAWTQMGGTVTGAVTALRTTGGAGLQVNGHSESTQRGRGDFFQASIMNGISGTVVAHWRAQDFIFRDSAPARAAGPVGRIWQLNGPDGAIRSNKFARIAGAWKATQESTNGTAPKPFNLPDNYTANEIVFGTLGYDGTPIMTTPSLDGDGAWNELWHLRASDFGQASPTGAAWWKSMTGSEGTTDTTQPSTSEHGSYLTTRIRRARNLTSAWKSVVAGRGTQLSHPVPILRGLDPSVPYLILLTLAADANRTIARFPSQWHQASQQGFGSTSASVAVAADWVYGASDYKAPDAWELSGTDEGITSVVAVPFFDTSVTDTWGRANQTETAQPFEAALALQATFGFATETNDAFIFVGLAAGDAAFDFAQQAEQAFPFETSVAITAAWDFSIDDHIAGNFLALLDGVTPPDGGRGRGIWTNRLWWVNNRRRN